MMPPIDTSHEHLAARYLRRQIKQLTGQAEGIRRAEDVEFVHRARVASRRLRVGLRVFADCFSAGQVKSWRKEVRRVGRGLGETRDLDVQVALLCDVLSRLEDRTCVSGVAQVLVRCQRKRDQLQPRVVKAMGRLLASRALHDMLLAVLKMLPEEGSDEPVSPSPALLDRAEKHVLRRFNDLYAFRTCLADPQDYEQHHAMRIAAKRLRYTMEIFKPLYLGKAEGAFEAVKQLQSLLGEIHDCDLWVEQLQRIAEKQSKRLQPLYGHVGPRARLKAGLDYLQQDRRQRRRELFAALVQYWEKLSREEVWDGLLQIVRLRGVPAVAPQEGNGREVVRAADAASPAGGAETASPIPPADDGGDGSGPRSPEHRLPAHWHAAARRGPG
jgi:CHAD domain-containing protein